VELLPFNPLKVFTKEVVLHPSYPWEVSIREAFLEMEQKFLAMVVFEQNPLGRTSLATLEVKLPILEMVH
jgi:hypothetical protein